MGTRVNTQPNALVKLYPLRFSPAWEAKLITGGFCKVLLQMFRIQLSGEEFMDVCPLSCDSSSLLSSPEDLRYFSFLVASLKGQWWVGGWSDEPSELHSSSERKETEDRLEH